MCKGGREGADCKGSAKKRAKDTNDHGKVKGRTWFWSSKIFTAYLLFLLHFVWLYFYNDQEQIYKYFTEKNWSGLFHKFIHTKDEAFCVHFSNSFTHLWMTAQEMKAAQRALPCVFQYI